MHLLRRPLRPRLRPLLLSEITVAGQAEPLSPLSSVSSSTTNSAPSSRPSSHTRSPRYLPPLDEEHSHHASLVTPFQSEPTGVDQLTVAMMNEDDDDDEEDEEEQKEEFTIRKKSKKLLAPLKTREYTQFSGFTSTTIKSKNLEHLIKPRNIKDHHLYQLDEHDLLMI